MRSQTIRLFTPAFQQAINSYVEQNVQQTVFDLADQSDAIFIKDISPETAFEIAYRSTIHLLEQHWIAPIPSVELYIPEELGSPEYVEYTFNSEDIGQPLLPTAIPSSFVPKPISEAKAHELLKTIEQIVASTAAELANKTEINQQFLKPADPIDWHKTE